MSHEHIYRLLSRYIVRTITEDELKELRTQVNNFDDEKLAAVLSNLWENYEIDRQPNCALLDGMFDQIKKQILPQRTFGSRYSWIIKVAVVILLLLTTGSSIYYYSISQRVDPDMVLWVEKAQKAILTLPDGSKVWVNANSMLSYGSRFNRKERVIHLDGEAYFEIAHDKKRPFIVETKEQDIEALGTKFNVMAYATDSLIITTLSEGCVRLTTDNLGEKIILKPNQQLTYNKNQHKNRKQQVDVSRVTSWTDGYYNFQSQPLKQILHRMNYIYGMTFQVHSEKLNNKVFSGTFYREQSLREIMDVISTSYPLKYAIKDDVVIVSE